MNHVVVGVYINGKHRVNIVKPEHLQDHIEYNKNYRPGRLLFVDGKYICGGVLEEKYLSLLIKEWERRIKIMNIDNSVPSEMYV